MRSSPGSWLKAARDPRGVERAPVCDQAPPKEVGNAVVHLSRGQRLRLHPSLVDLVIITIIIINIINIIITVDLTFNFKLDFTLDLTLDFTLEYTFDST